MRAPRLASRKSDRLLTGSARRRARTIGLTLVTLAVSSAFVGVTPATSAPRACVAWTGGQPANAGINSNALVDAAVLSPCYTWAVGTWRNNPAEHQTLIEHFNGSDWTRVASPRIGAADDDVLNGVAVTSTSNAWAVGSYSNGTAEQTLVLRWNGSSWNHKKSPNPAGLSNDDVLNDVVATSATNAWAVGSYHSGSDLALIERWNGTAWKVVPSPTPGTFSLLSAVAATSASNAWAVGSYGTGAGYLTLILRWNGSVWKRVPSPNPGGPTNDNHLQDVAATSSSNAIAVGSYKSGGVQRTLTERWNGSHWRWAWSPNPASGDNALSGVDASSATNAWAVGFQHTSLDLTLAMHCC